MVFCYALCLANNSGLVKRAKNAKIPLRQVPYTSLPREDIAPREGTKTFRRTLHFIISRPDQSMKSIIDDNQ